MSRSRSSLLPGRIGSHLPERRRCLPCSHAFDRRCHLDGARQCNGKSAVRDEAGCYEAFPRNQSTARQIMAFPIRTAGQKVRAFMAT